MSLKKENHFVFADYEMKEMAVFVAELVRQGVTFSVDRDHSRFLIELTGGF